MNLVELILRLQELEKEAVNVPEVLVKDIDNFKYLWHIEDVKLGPDKDIVVIEL
jgi:hypothetical protein